MTNNLWFKAKRYGWGWTPCTWQGWLVTALFALFEFLDFRRLDMYSHSASDTLRPFLIDTFFAILVLLFICLYKGEKPGWRWGNNKK